MRMFNRYLGAAGLLALVGALTPVSSRSERRSPLLHGRHWMAVTGKPSRPPPPPPSSRRRVMPWTRRAP